MKPVIITADQAADWLVMLARLRELELPGDDYDIR